MPTPVSQAPFVIRPNPDLLKEHPELGRYGRDLARAYANQRYATDDALKAIGQALWRVLDIDDAFNQARERAGNLVLPVIIESEAAEIQQLPWETLHHPKHGFLATAKRFALSRRLADTKTEQPSLEKGPLRVLLFTSLPDDLDAESGRLDVEEEQAQIQEALTPAIMEGLVALGMPDDGRFATLQERIASFEPHVVFLSGHGKFINEPHQKRPPFAIFQFEDDDGHSDLVEDEKIAEAFRGTGVLCVALSACESGMGSSNDLTVGLAWRLSEIGISHVAGMRESVFDRAGILFNRAFADALAGRERIDVALQEGREAIRTPLKDSPYVEAGSGAAELSLAQWCLPMLLSRDVGQPLLDWAFEGRPPQVGETRQMLDTVTLPPRFIGRRTELRHIKSRFHKGELAQLLITGPGGQARRRWRARLPRILPAGAAGRFLLTPRGRGICGGRFSGRCSAFFHRREPNNIPVKNRT